jgi:hypothetical protein
MPLFADPSPAQVSPGKLAPPEVLFETLEHNVQLVLAALMLPCSTHVSFCLFIVKERVLMHPAVHIGLGSACGYIPPPPPPFGPGNMFSSRGLCLTFAHLFLSRTFADKNTFTVLPD